MARRATRARRAEVLRERLMKGPAFSFRAMLPSEDANRAEDLAQRSYRIWYETWVADLVHDLVPELRSKRDEEDLV